MAGATLGTAYVQIVPSAQGIKGSIQNALDPESKNAGQSVGANIVSFAKKAIIGGAIGKALKDTLSEGAALQQSYIGGLDTLYGDAADAVRNYAKAAAEAGISMNTYSEQAISFGAALKQAFGGDVVKAAEAANTAILDMADNSAKMGTDIESIQMAYQGFAKQNYTMLDNLKLGYGGTKSEMERLLADAQALTGVEYNIDNLGDVYEAIHVIQGELELTGVAADEASATLSGSFNAMKATVKNFLGSLVIGEDIEGVTNMMLESVISFGKNLVQAFGNILLNLPKALGQLGDLIIAKVMEIGDSPNISIAASEFIKTLVVGLVTNLPKLLAGIAGLAGLMVSTLVRTLGALLKPAIVTIANAFGNIRSALASRAIAAVNAVRNAFAAVRAAIVRPFEAAKNTIKGVIDGIKKFFPFRIGKVMSGLKLPHFSISGKFSLTPPSIPRISVSWYKKAENAPYMFGNATLFGAGERNDEMLYGHDALMRDIREAAGGGGNNVTINVTVNGADNPEDWARRLARQMQLEMRTI